jgi:hypothetical protein
VDVRADLLPCLPGLVEDAPSFVTRLVELAAVPLQELARLLAVAFGPLDVALDPIGPLLQDLADPLEHTHAPQDHQEDEERDRPPDQLVRGRDERVLLLGDEGDVGEHAYPLTKTRTAPIRVSTSVNAMPRIMVV